MRSTRASASTSEPSARHFAALSFTNTRYGLRAASSPFTLRQIVSIATKQPVILKLSPDYDYLEHARLAERYGVAGLTAINAVKALRLDPETGKPYLKNRYGALSGRAIKPIGLRIVSELREAGIRLPIIASAGIRDFDDCREFFWAGADACSLGSAVWLKPMPLYALGPIEGLRIRRLIDRVAAYEVPAREAQPIDFNAGSVAAPVVHPIEAEPFEAIDDADAPDQRTAASGQTAARRRPLTTDRRRRSPDRSVTAGRRRGLLFADRQHRSPRRLTRWTPRSASRSAATSLLRRCCAASSPCAPARRAAGTWTSTG